MPNTPLTLKRRPKRYIPAREAARISTGLHSIAEGYRDEPLVRLAAYKEMRELLSVVLNHTVGRPKRATEGQILSRDELEGRLLKATELRARQLPQPALVVVPADRSH